MFSFIITIIPIILYFVLVDLRNLEDKLNEDISHKSIRNLCETGEVSNKSSSTQTRESKMDIEMADDAAEYNSGICSIQKIDLLY